MTRYRPSSRARPAVSRPLLSSPLLVVASLVFFPSVVAHHNLRLSARVRARGSLSTADPRARRQEEGPPHVTAEMVACLYSAAIPPFRGRGAVACAHASRRPRGSAREFQNSLAHSAFLHSLPLSTFLALLTCDRLDGRSSCTTSSPSLHSQSSLGEKIRNDRKQTKRFPLRLAC